MSQTRFPTKPAMSEGAVDARIVARLAELEDAAKIAQARFPLRGPLRPGEQQRALLRLLEREPMTPHQAWTRLGAHTLYNIAHMIAGLVQRGMVERDGDSLRWRAIVKGLRP